MSKAEQRWRAAATAALAGGAFVLVEVVLAPATRPAVGVGVGGIALAVAGLAVLHAGAALLAGRWGRRALLLPVVAWSMVWGPEQARDRGLPDAVGWVPPAVLLAVGMWRPEAAALLALAGALPADAFGPDMAPPQDRVDIVLVTVDTVRADAGLLEAAGATGPGWWAGQGVAAAPWTPPSLHSLFLGVPVDGHGAGIEGPAGISARDPAHTGLAEDLRARGYHTAAFVSNPHLRTEAGFAQGFTTWAHADRAPAPALLLRTGRLGLRRWLGRYPASQATDRDLVDAAARWLARGPAGGRFLWLHLMGPHAWTREHADGRPAAPGGDGDADRDRYTAHVAQTGAALRALWPAVSSDAVVVLTADHGEHLGEAGRWGHGRALTPELHAVPLAVRGFALQAEGADAPLTALRGALVSVADGGLGWLPPAEGARLAGVRGDAGARAVWRGGTVHAAPQGDSPQGAPAALGPADRAALERLGYLDAEGER